MIKRDTAESALQRLLCDLKIHLRITSNDQDAVLFPYVQAAARSAEHHIGRCLLDSTFTYSGKFSPSVVLPNIDADYYPLIEVASVRVDEETVEASQYTVDGDALTFSEGVTGAAVEIKYTAGGLDMEPDIKAAILLTASKYFNNPVDSVETLPSVASNLLRPYRRWGLKNGKQN